MTLLFLPKLLALLDLVGRAESVRAFGGWRRVLGGALLETVWSALFAPVLMLFHCKFFAWLALGRSVAWVAQRRGGDGAPDWREVILTHAGQTGVGLVWAVVAWVLNPTFFAWLAPVLVGLVGSIPLAIFVGAPEGKAGRGGERWLGTPEENAPPAVLRELADRLATLEEYRYSENGGGRDRGLMQAVLDPYVNAVHVSLLREKTAAATAERERFGRLRERLMAEGPEAIGAADKMALLLDAPSMIRLHHEIWSRSGLRLADAWRCAIREYNLVAPAPRTALHP